MSINKTIITTANILKAYSVLGTMLNNHFYSLNVCVTDIILISILQKRKLRLSEVQQEAQDHSQNSSPDWSNTEGQLYYWSVLLQLIILNVSYSEFKLFDKIHINSCTTMWIYLTPLICILKND